MTTLLRMPMIFIAITASTSLSFGTESLSIRERPLSDYSALRERPLFSPSRTGPIQFVAPEPEPVVVIPEPEPEPEPVPAAAPDWQLVGIVRSERLNSATFTSPAEIAAFTLRKGETHQGWTLKIVSQFEVKLDGAGGRATLRFSDEASDAPTDWQDQSINYEPEGETAIYGQGG